MYRWGFALFLFSGIIGCNDTPSRTFTSEELEKLAGDRMKGIADDKSLSDEDAFKKYFDTHGSKPSVILPPGVAPWTHVTKSADGFTLEVHDIVHALSRGETPEAAMTGERNAIKANVNLCRAALSDFKSRKLKSVTVKLFAAFTGKEGYEEVFRAMATIDDLPKLEKAKSTADKDSEFDPRGKRIGEYWKVELNKFPGIQYSK